MRIKRRSILVLAAGVTLVGGCREGVPPFEPALREALQGSTRRLTFGPSRDQNPTWSRSSDSIYYSTGALHTMYTMSVDVGLRTPLEPAAHVAGSFGGAFSLSAPAISPDGERLAYVQLFCEDAPTCARVVGARLRVRPVGALRSAAADPGVALSVDTIPKARRMMEHLAYRPAWSPDGSRIAFADSAGVKIWDLTAAPPALVAGTENGAAAVAWSPDGSLLAFEHLTPADTMVMLVSPAGTGLRALVQGREPAWSPDSRTIYYADSMSLRRVSVDGDASSTIDGTERGRTPAVSPNGRWLAFARSKQEPASRDLDLWLIELMTPGAGQ